MSATTSSKDGPLRNKLSANPKNFLPSRVCALLLALVPVFAPPGIAQSADVKRTPLDDFVGTYKEQSSEKRVRILEKDGRLVYEFADGLTLALFHLVQSEPGDAFQIEETTRTARDQVRFARDGAGRVSSLSFAGDTYL